MNPILSGLLYLAAFGFLITYVIYLIPGAKDAISNALKCTEQIGGSPLCDFIDVMGVATGATYLAKAGSAIKDTLGVGKAARTGEELRSASKAARAGEEAEEGLSLLKYFRW